MRLKDDGSTGLFPSFIYLLKLIFVCICVLYVHVCTRPVEVRGKPLGVGPCVPPCLRKCLSCCPVPCKPGCLECNSPLSQEDGHARMTGACPTVHCSSHEFRDHQACMASALPGQHLSPSPGPICVMCHQTPWCSARPALARICFHFGAVTEHASTATYGQTTQQ